MHSDDRSYCRAKGNWAGAIEFLMAKRGDEAFDLAERQDEMPDTRMPLKTMAVIRVCEDSEVLRNESGVG